MEYENYTSYYFPYFPMAVCFLTIVLALSLIKYLGLSDVVVESFIYQFVFWVPFELVFYAVGYYRRFRGTQEWGLAI